jgi:hypothetical protein
VTYDSKRVVAFRFIVILGLARNGVQRVVYVLRVATAPVLAPVARNVTEVCAARRGKTLMITCS